MKLNDAIKTLDDVIPSPDNKMVDGDHKEIAIAWKEIREYLTNEDESIITRDIEWRDDGIICGT